MTGSHIRITPGPARQCARCGGVGTHYLTCPSLRLPPGYRLSEVPAPAQARRRGEQRIAGAAGPCR